MREKYGVRDLFTTIPLGAAHTYIAHIWEYSPTRHITKLILIDRNASRLIARGIRRYRLSLVSLYKLLTGFRQKVLKIALETLRNKFHFEFFNSSHRVDSSTKSTIVYVLLAAGLTDHRLWIVQYIFLFSRILLQEPRAPLEGVSAHFSNMNCIILKEMRGREIFDLPG